MSKKIAIIGAGVTGVTTAYQLTRAGYQVTLYDRHPYAAMETSFANGGQLSASNAEVWNSWGTVLKGLQWMLTPGAPLLVRPTVRPDRIYWMLRFLRAIPSYEANTIATARLAIEAREQLLAMAEAEGIECDFSMKGILHVYQDKVEFARAAHVTRLLRRAGLERRRLTQQEVSDLEPALHGAYVGGYYTPSDFTGDIHSFTIGLANACARRGATLRLSTGVHRTRSRPDGIEVVSDSDTVLFDKLVVCAGVASRRIARKLGDAVPVEPIKGYSITVNLHTEQDQRAAPNMSLLDDKKKIVTSRLGPNRFRVAGTAEFAGENRDIRTARIKPLIDWCRDHFPEMSTRDVTPWAGLRPMMPDMMPAVRTGRNSRVIYNTGHGHLGWTLSAATAVRVVQLANR